ncbi:MAG: polymerase IV protein [Parcubacteria group bacterium GW2011_GWC2_39_14]|nr:MAG: polymerase IV protein [Parcubacteria group bacterium GW2011_GWC2_39_14]KKR54412.1 MAG: polymerase IV protein [Parcubacteria group bacterium GW2011_GWA2_40_23]
MTWRCILHVDMDSFFATAEQQANPSLRGRPIVVSGKEGSRSVIVASSKEAKKFGVKTGLLHHEAKKLCPQLIFVEPDGLKYDFLHRQLINVLAQITDKVEVFSIDEAFLDLSDCTHNLEQAQEVARRIKTMVFCDLGEWVTCSIGIAENKLLAKLASDKNKPNGLFIVDQDNIDQTLLESKLTDFCGLGPRTAKTLDEDFGIDSVSRLRELKIEKLVSLFGHARGLFLYNLCRGLDNSPVVPDSDKDEVKSVSRSHTLPQDTFNKDEILVVLMHLCESLAHELRHKKLSAKTIMIYLRYEDFTHGGFRLTLPGYINDTYQIFMIGYNRLMKFVLPKGVRLVGIYATNLIESFKQQNLFALENKFDQLSPFLDKINDAYGELTIKPAFLLNLKRLRNKVGGFRPTE